jgi:Na+-driven multidrug efflux pump
MFEDIYLLAGWGVCYASLLLLNTMWTLGLSFCASMLCSEHLGARNFREFRLTFYRCIGLGLFIGMVSILLFLRLDLILAWIGFSAQVSTLAWRGILVLIPFLLIQNFNEILKSYMIVQSFDKVFTITNIIGIFGGSLLAWLFVWHLQLGIIGIGISRGISETITCFILLAAWKMRGMQESFHAGETLTEIFCTKYFASFLRYYAGNTVPLMAAFIAFEAFTILFGVYGDGDLVSAWVVLQSIIALPFAMGIGWADTANVYVGFQIGQGCNKFAKKLAKWSVCLNWLGMMWYPVCLIVFHDEVAGWFTQIPGVHSVLSLWVFVWGFLGLSSVIIFTVSAMTRLAGQVFF